MPRLLLLSASLLALSAPGYGPALAQGVPGDLPPDRGLSYTFLGTPGLLELPTALSANEGELAGTLAFFGGQRRTALTAQLTPRVSATFRYENVDGFGLDDASFSGRAFDLRFRLTDEGARMPMIAVGLQDFLGTGLTQAEYVVATKTVGDSFRVTAGLGWGRLGERPDGGPDDGGFEDLFGGDAALFGGLEYAATDRLTVKLEYAPGDPALDADGEPLLDDASPLNIGLAFRPIPAISLQAAYLQGSEFALGATVSLNVNRRLYGSGLDAPPQPVAVRPDAAAALSWDRAALPEASLRDRLQTALRTEGVELLALEVTDRTARVRTVNTRFRAEAQALGRIARILTQQLPPSVETLTIEPVQRGIPLSAVTFARSDLEQFETAVGGAAATLDRAVLTDAGGGGGLVALPPIRDPFTWGLAPFVGVQIDVDDGVDLRLGVEASAAYRFAPNLVLSGAVRQGIIDGGEGSEAAPVGGLPVVRRDASLYGDEGLPTLERLTLAYFARPAPNLFARVSAGYLEGMYGGLSTELLWKPPTSRLGVGAEVNYAVKRDTDQLLGFQDYDVVTGHASLYYDIGGGFHGQVDAGRYLAGDIGATFSLDREWENGWVVGAYATVTEASNDVGGEAFDRGVRITIPTDFIFGQPTRNTVGTTLRAASRDDGARLSVGGRLYDVVRGAHEADLSEGWGRFWR